MLAQKVNQRSPFQLFKAESTRSLRSAGDQLKRKKIDCHFFSQQHLPASSAASGEIPCCLRKCPAELQGTQSTEAGLALCVPGVWECSTFTELPAWSINPTTVPPANKKRKGAEIKLDCEIGNRGMWQEGEQGECPIWPGQRCGGLVELGVEHPCTPWEENLARVTGKAQRTRNSGN